MNLFFSSCFSFQTRIDLILIKFYYNAVDVFWKLLEKLWGNDYVGNHFQQSLSYSKWTQVRVSFYQNSKHLFMVASKHSGETHSSELQNCLLQILQSHQKFVKKWKLFLIKYPEILRRDTFFFSLRAKFTYFLKCIPLKKKTREA